MRGFTYQGYHYKWYKSIGYYWCESPKAFWQGFAPDAIPKDVTWDKEN